MRIVVDAMGGDHAPAETVAGAVKAARKWPSTEILLVGQSNRIEEQLDLHGHKPSNIHVHHAPDVVTMSDEPTFALRRKKHSSMKVGVDLVRDGKAVGFVTAGNTGAMVGFCTLGLGRLPGVLRAGFVAPMPSAKSIFALVDVGANINCVPENLNQFAAMASVYMQEVGGVKHPVVGLLNVGTEETKGTPFIKEAHKLLQQNRGINYIGYVEGHTIFDGDVHVVVTDGFLGNVVLKISEGLSSSLIGLVKKAMGSSIQSIIGAALSRRAFAEVKKSIDVSEYGGAMLLGVNGIAVKCHGRADSHTIYNGVNVVRNAVQHRMNERISERLESLKTVS